MPTIEIRRMVTGVESCTVNVDDDTLKTILNKTVTREELADLMWDGSEITIDAHEHEEPHSVYYNFHTYNVEECRSNTHE